MDYLVIEGYKSAAEKFGEEAGVPPKVDFQSIESRMKVREALQRGDVEDAIVRMNELNPEVSVWFVGFVLGIRCVSLLDIGDKYGFSFRLRCLI